MPLCSPGGAFQLPGRKTFLPKVANWAEVFPLGTAQMPSQSAVGQARSAGSYKRFPEPSLNQTSMHSSLLPTRDLEARLAGPAASGRDGGSPSFQNTPMCFHGGGEVCRREMALSNGLPDSFLMPAFAFTPQRKLPGPLAVIN